ncbi:MAG TPA: acid phosphatase [Solirubrobacteraceae bacterium]
MTGSIGRAALLALIGSALLAAPAAAHGGGGHGGGLKKIDHFVVIYQENHSFDNLYGGWEGVDGVASADRAHTAQINQAGAEYQCLLQNDVNLTSPPLSATCTNTAPAFTSHFTNAPFRIDDYIAPEDTTCPAPGVFAANGVPKGTGLPGGCTRDLVHRFYQEQYQLNGGRQNRYTTGSDAVGLTMGYYDTRRLPIYEYLHERGHPDYTISDRFFQAAFGGSFLNHQWLVAAATPVFFNARSDGSADDLHSLVDANGMPISYPLYTATGTVKDAALTVPCSSPRPAGLACGDYAVNTIQPPYQPYAPGTAEARRLPPQTAPTIGSRLSGKGIDWAWYSGGWSNANGDVGDPGWTNGTGPACSDPNALATAVFPNCPDKLFQFHHQPFNYFSRYAPDTRARARHLRDEEEFEALAAASRRHCRLKPVSIIKPIGAENEHPGYASESAGSNHLIRLLRAVQDSRCAKDTMVVVTYDEFGGQWDHVSPPVVDKWGPGTRIPALVLSAGFVKSGIDSTQYDTTSIMRTIERAWNLAPVATRDAVVNDLQEAVRAGDPRRHGRFGG